MLRLSERYTSVQGEGPNAGLPTQFVRFAGCNLRCPGWPCDTPFAVDPAIWRSDSEPLSAQALVGRIPSWPKNICFTGGEPLIQPDVELQELVELLHSKEYRFEMFTNGSKLIPAWALGIVRFMMDWKLPGSGEYDSIDPAVRLENAQRLFRGDGIKFVVAGQTDLDQARQDWQELVRKGVVAQFWATPVWGVDPKTVIDYIFMHQLPWKLSLQVHKYIWQPDERGV